MLYNTWLNVIDKIKYYFVELICERKIMSKELNKLD